jgi:hypothetical protein
MLVVIGELVAESEFADSALYQKLAGVSGVGGIGRLVVGGAGIGADAAIAVAAYFADRAAASSSSSSLPGWFDAHADAVPSTVYNHASGYLLLSPMLSPHSLAAAERVPPTATVLLLGGAGK